MSEATHQATSTTDVHLADPAHNQSFTKGVFLGELREELVFPFPEPSAEDREALDMVLGGWAQFAGETLDARKHDHDAKFDDAVREGMHQMGLMGVNIPQAYGGFGASALVFNRVFAEVASTDPAIGVYFGAHQSIGCKGITLFGTEAQKQKYLTRCATGELIAAFCLTEPGSGSDAQAMKSTAVPTEDGSAYVLNGTKIWISNAGYAGLFTVFAKVPVEVDGKKKGRVTAFIVDAKAEGVSLGKLEEKMGIKASDTRTVFFDNVRVPKEDLLGEVGQGFKIALEILNSGRLGLSAGSALGTRKMMKVALEHATQREQFGRPIAGFEMIQRKFAQAAAEVYALDAAWTLTAGMVDRGGIDFSLETAACKIFGSELAYRAANDALQIAGGIGYSKEYPYEQFVRDARINLIFEGTNEILRALVALSALQEPGERLKSLGRAFKQPLQHLGALSEYVTGRVKRQLKAPSFTKVHPALAREAEMVAKVVHDLALGVEGVLMKHGKQVIERQFIQERLANAAIDVFLCTATLSRATAALAKQEVESEPAQAELDCARIFIPMACRRARRAVRALSRNQDQRMRAIAERAVATGELAPKTPLDQ